MEFLTPGRGELQGLAFRYVGGIFRCDGKGARIGRRPLQGRFVRPGFRGGSASDIISLVNRPFRLSLALLFLVFISFLPASTSLQAQTEQPTANSILPGSKPPDVSPDWKEVVGVYGKGKNPVIILEHDGKLIWLRSDKQEEQIEDYDRSRLVISPRHGPLVDAWIKRNSAGAITDLVTMPRVLATDPPVDPYQKPAGIKFDPSDLVRVDAGPDHGHFYHMAPVRPVEDLRAKALKLTPPDETGQFRQPDLIELATLDPAIHPDIRYATANNFLSTPVYTEARAFLQRPAAEALLRVLHKLQPLGYGLLIHDAYRPWYVTKIFWDATPPEGKIFVADPQKGSKHNRGCAVDLTLYDLQTGKASEMPGLYDEMSPRSFPSFPGGTSLQRWNRELLRRAMESEGFTVNEDEWWHFDYKDWKQYPILNLPFEKINGRHKP